jgi:hypothetical protein
LDSSNKLLLNFLHQLSQFLICFKFQEIHITYPVDMSSPDQPEVSKFRGRPAKAKKHAGRAPIYTFPEDITAPEKVAFYIENKKSKDAGNGALEPENWLEEYRERAPPVKKSPGRASIYNIPPGWKPSEKSSFYLAAKAARDQGDAIPDPKTWLEEYRTREKKPRGRPAAVKAEVKKAVAGRGRGRPATKAKVENSSTPTSPKTNKTTDAARVLIETLAASEGFKTALEEAREGGAEGGIPIGACLVAADGVILAQGRNMRIQGDSAIQHVSLQCFFVSC